MDTSSSHIVFSKLVDLVDGRLSADETAGVTAHLSGCQECSAMGNRLREIFELMRADSSESPPAYVMARVIDMLPGGRRGAAATGSTAIRRVLAALKFDSAGLAPAYGVRSESSGERQLLFQAGETQLHLQISPAGEDWIITGQVLGASGDGQVELQGLSGMVQAALDERCEFVLPAVGEGSYGMVLRLTDLELEVPELKLGIQQ
jgi:anti-sigma factor RsiW